MTSDGQSGSNLRGSSALEAPRGPASEFREVLRDDPAVDAREFLARNPDLAGQKSVVLDLAYEEYCQRAEAGEKLDPQEFCARFPECRHSLQKLLDVHRFIGDLGRAAPIVWPEPGDEVLGYRVREELGRGAFSRVYLAEEMSLGRRLVAVKIATANVGQEADALGRLDHPHIVPVYSVRHDIETQLSFVCMPFLGRATLYDVIQRAKDSPRRPALAQLLLDVARNGNLGLPAEDLPRTGQPPRVRGSYVDGVITVGQQLSRALAAAHHEGILHLDVKPSNVLLARDGRPMLLDFNLSQTQASDLPRVGGTIPYMSPEQLLGLIHDKPAERQRSAKDEQTVALDSRADLFSLGVTLYELLTGKLPFGPVPVAEERSVVARQLRELQKNGPLPLRRLNPDVDARFATIIERCLAFHPDERPPSAAALAAQLGKCLAPQRRLWRWMRPRRRAIAGVAASCLAAAIAGATYVSTLDPYHVRAVAAGNAALQRHDYPLALSSFDAALQAEAGDIAAREGRARALIGQGRFSIAVEDLTRIPDSSRSPESWALEAYCCNKLGQNAAAAAAYETAVRQGYTTAEVWNNLGYTYQRLSRLADAERALATAILLAPELQAPWFNRAIVRLNIFEREQLPAPLAGAVEDIERALPAGLPSGEMHLFAAELYARLARNDPGRAREAREQLVLALRYGVKADMIRTHPLPLLNSLQTDPQVSVLLNADEREFRTEERFGNRILNVARAPQPAIEVTGDLAAGATPLR